MDEIDPLPELEKGRKQPYVRQSYKVLERAHSSVEQLFAAAGALEAVRREANSSKKGRKARLEVDILRSAIVMTSAGLDASMKRLVNDVGRELIVEKGSSARKQYQQYLKEKMPQSSVAKDFRDAVVADEPGEDLLAFYLAERTKSSYQGSKDLLARVKRVLGISNAAVDDHDVMQLDPFFRARNQIVHDMDLKDITTKSIARVRRDAETVAYQCNAVFYVAVLLIRGAAEACWEIQDMHQVEE